jgi:hypothetical protein
MVPGPQILWSHYALPSRLKRSESSDPHLDPTRLQHEGACHFLGIKKSLAYQTLAYQRLYGIPYNPFPYRHGRPRLLSNENLKFVVALVKRRHCIYLDEIQAIRKMVEK